MEFLYLQITPWDPGGAGTVMMRKSGSKLRALQTLARGRVDLCGHSGLCVCIPEWSG